MHITSLCAAFTNAFFGNECPAANARAIFFFPFRDIQNKYLSTVSRRSEKSYTTRKILRTIVAGIRKNIKKISPSNPPRLSPELDFIASVQSIWESAPSESTVTFYHLPYRRGNYLLFLFYVHRLIQETFVYYNYTIGNAVTKTFSVLHSFSERILYTRKIPISYNK